MSLPQANLPAWGWALYQWNPMAGTIALERVAFLGEAVPTATLLTPIPGTLAVLGLGVWLFQRLAPRFAA